MEHHPAQSIKLADQYLAAAKLCLELRLTNPAISMAVHSAIHAKDAVYLKETGVIPKPRSHGQAPGDLRSLGVLKESAIRQFARLIASKSEAEYGQENLPVLDAVSSVQDAERFLLAVKTFLGSN
ncbi:MAG TPA: HEPN domain-containing protein [Aquiluna sp.]